MPTHVQVEFRFLDKIGDNSLAGFTLGQMLFKSCCPSLLVGKTLTRFRFWSSHRQNRNPAGVGCARPRKGRCSALVKKSDRSAESASKYYPVSEFRFPYHGFAAA